MPDPLVPHIPILYLAATLKEIPYNTGILREGYWKKTFSKEILPIIPSFLPSVLLALIEGASLNISERWEIEAIANTASDSIGANMK